MPTGHLIYAIAGNLFAVAFDMATLSITGGAVPVVQDVLRGVNTRVANYDVTTDGSLVYIEGTEQSDLNSLVWVDRNGGETPISIEPGVYTYPRISPNGQRVAIDDRSVANDIWIWDFAALTRTRLSTGTSGGQYPVWTADGTGIAFWEAENFTISLRAANNTGQTTALLKRELGTEGNLDAYFFSPSGQELVFRVRDTSPPYDDIRILSVKGEFEPTGLLAENYTERNAELSPNGRWMAYESNESGSSEIYFRPFPNVDDDKVQVSSVGGIKPLWSRDGSELFYLQPGSGATQLMAVSVQPDGATFASSNRTALLDWPYRADGQGRTYDVSLDGQQFLAIKPVVSADPEESSNQIVIILNWTEELNRLLSR